MPHSYNTRSTAHSSTTSPTSSPNSSPASFVPPTPPPSRTNNALPLLSSATLLAEAAKRAQMACLLRDMEGEEEEILKENEEVRERRWTEAAVVHTRAGADSTAIAPSDTDVQMDGRRTGTTTHTTAHTTIDGLLAYR
ncbi:hypothetical protein VF21_00300 [Pseudogymnoascus sp. 05NY08]|nr:hypothetical protein VF21_00300 [Pseudogymnoascus sp. 05NY08]